MQFSAGLPFGDLLKRLRKEAGMTQRDLAAALGYSEAMICSLEKAQRLPDLQAVMKRFIPALGLQDDPAAAALIEQAALVCRTACADHSYSPAHNPKCTVSADQRAQNRFTHATHFTHRADRSREPGQSALSPAGRPPGSPVNP